MRLTIPHRTLGFRFGLAIALIAAIGVLAALYSTSLLGIGTDADSATYLMAAQSLVTGKGLTLPTADGRQLPMTSFPPLLPMVLAAFGFMGVDPLSGARWLNAVLFGADIVLVGFLVKRTTQSSPMAVLGACLTATSVDVLLNHCLLISEPLFLIFAFVGLVGVTLYIEGPSFPLLFLFSAAFALAGATRYAGVSLLPVGALAILLGAGASRRRWLHFGALLAIFGAPLSLWALRNLAQVHALSNRSLAFHPPDLNRFVYSYLSLSTWILPSVVPPALRVLALSAAILLLLRPLLRRFGTNSSRWSFQDVGMMFVVSYVLVFVISQTLFDAQIWIAGRHLLAVYLFGLIVVVCEVQGLFDRSTRYSRAALLLVCCVIIGVGFFRVAKNAVRFRQEGIGLSSRRWQTSVLAAKVKDIDSRTPLISNAGSAVYLLTGRLTHSLPSRVNSQTKRDRPEYAAEIDRMRLQLRENGGVVVFFTAFGTLPSEREMEQQLEVQRVATTDDGFLLASRVQDGAYHQ
jgi:hypothetical protein